VDYVKGGKLVENKERGNPLEGTRSGDGGASKGERSGGGRNRRGRGERNQGEGLRQISGELGRKGRRTGFGNRSLTEHEPRGGNKKMIRQI